MGIGAGRIAPEIEPAAQVGHLIGVHPREMAIEGAIGGVETAALPRQRPDRPADRRRDVGSQIPPVIGVDADGIFRSEEHTSELQSLMRISYAVFCLKKKKKSKN